MLVNVFSAAVTGLVATIVEVEINATQGAKFFITGLPDAAVRESYSRVVSAIENAGYRRPLNNLVINLAPADIRKEGSSFDLPIAIGCLAVSGMISPEKLGRTMLLGELGLDGRLRPTRGCLTVAIEARRAGFDALIVPRENVMEAAVVDKLKVYGASNLVEVIDFLNGREGLEPTVFDTRAEFLSRKDEVQPDFSEVKGQENVKRACEVAAAGGHNLLLIGSPGCGKSMLAKRMPSILPPLTMAESLETTQIHSVAGILPEGVSLLHERPFRSPHHTISNVALIGGGSNFRPGEISLAHNGVLFLDELPEFGRVLETLRQPLEDRVISINRAKYSVKLPCSFMLMAAMNPCPCGYYNDPTHHCTCTPRQVKNYMSRISEPLLDRLDLQIEVTPVSFSDLAAKPAGESSAAIRERVVAARLIQQQRFRSIKGIHCNAQMTDAQLGEFAPLDDGCRRVIRTAMERRGLSARAYKRINKIARTIADLDGAEHIDSRHVIEAVGYRSLDRSKWGE